jgi:hypothetical protein
MNPELLSLISSQLPDGGASLATVANAPMINNPKRSFQIQGFNPGAAFNAGVVDVTPVAQTIHRAYAPQGMRFWDAMAIARNAIQNFNNVLGNNTAISGPQTWVDVTQGRPGAGPEAFTRGIPQPLGLGSVICPPAGAVSLQVNASKPMTADRLILQATTTAGTQLAHLFVTRVDIGGNTYLNGGNRVPLSTFQNVDSFRNFAGVVIQTSQQITVTFENAGVDPSLVSGSISGYAGTP